MYLSIHPNQFNIHYVMLSEKTKNNVMDNGDFFRLYYSDNLCNSNGLYIHFSLYYFIHIRIIYINSSMFQECVKHFRGICDNYYIKIF